MSNGRGPIGSIEAETGTVFIGAWWTSSESGIELQCFPNPDTADLIGDAVALSRVQAQQLVELLQNWLDGKGGEQPA